MQTSVKSEIPQEVVQTESKRYIISIDSLSKKKLIDCNIPIDTSKYNEVIFIEPKKIGDTKNALYENFQKIPNGSEILIYLKMHGCKGEKTTQEAEKLCSIYDDNLMINSKEIIEIVDYGRGCKGFKICGLLHVCYGSTYKELIKCFDLCISTDKISMGASPNILYSIINFYKNSKNFYKDFENNFYNEFSQSSTSLVWAFGEAESQDEKRWYLSKNETNIRFGNFINIWNNVISKNNMDEIKIKNFLESNGFNLNYLINNCETESDLNNFINKMLKFSYNYTIAYQFLKSMYIGNGELSNSILSDILIKNNKTRNDLYKCQTSEELIKLYLIDQENNFKENIYLKSVKA